MQELESILNKYNLLQYLCEVYSLDDEIKSFTENEIKLLKNSIESYQNNEFNITIVAPMKAGKSSFINALIGEDLMPSESEACTFFPIEIKLNSSDKNIYKIYNDGTKKLVGSKKHYKRIHDDIRKIRTGEVSAENLDRYEIGLKLEGIKVPDDFKINLIDLPGINEAEDDTNRNIEKMFLDILEKSNQIIYLFDIQYYKSSENVDILNKIKLCRPDLMDNILFILTKIDNFDFNKGKSIEDTKNDIKNILKQLSIEDAAIIGCSSKLELVSHELDKGIAADNRNLLYKILSSFSIEPIRNIGKKLSKAEKIVEKNYDYISKNITLKSTEVDGKTMFVFPEYSEIVNNMRTDSDFQQIEDKIQDMFNNIDSIKKKQSNNTLELSSSNFEEVTSVIVEDSESVIKELTSSPELQEIEQLKNGITKINNVRKFSSANSKVDFNKIKNILENSVRNERKNMKPTAYYDTDWHEYSSDVCSVKETVVGRYIEDLELEATRKYRDLVNVLENNIGSIINTYKKDVITAAQKYVDNLNNMIQDIYSSMNVAFNSKVLLNINENNLYSIEIPRKFYGSVDYDCKRGSRQVGFIFKSTEYYYKYKIRNMSNFKDSCYYYADEAVRITARNIVQKLNVELVDIINKNIKNQLDNHVKTLKYGINDKKKQAKDIYENIDKLKKLIVDIGKCRDNDNSVLKEQIIVDDTVQPNTNNVADDKKTTIDKKSNSLEELKKEDKNRNAKVKTKSLKAKKEKSASSSKIMNTVRNIAALLLAVILASFSRDIISDTKVCAFMTFAVITLIAMKVNDDSRVFKLIKNLSCIILAIDFSVLLYYNCEKLIHMRFFLLADIVLGIIFMFIVSSLYDKHKEQSGGNISILLERIFGCLFFFACALIIYKLLAGLLGFSFKTSIIITEILFIPCALGSVFEDED